MKIQLSGEVYFDSEHPSDTAKSPFDIQIEISDFERNELLRHFHGGVKTIMHLDLIEEMPWLVNRIEVEAFKECQRRFHRQPFISLIEISRDNL